MPRNWGPIRFLLPCHKFSGEALNFLSDGRIVDLLANRVAALDDEPYPAVNGDMANEPDLVADDNALLFALLAVQHGKQILPLEETKA